MAKFKGVEVVVVSRKIAPPQIEGVLFVLQEEALKCYRWDFELPQNVEAYVVRRRVRRMRLDHSLSQNFSAFRLD
jgi:hypothetical protein